MNRIPFEARAFWHLDELLDAVTDTPNQRRRVREWLKAANAIQKTPTNGSVVTRVALERHLPWVLEALRRVSTLRDGG